MKNKTLIFLILFFIAASDFLSVPILAQAQKQQPTVQPRSYVYTENGKKQAALEYLITQDGKTTVANIGFSAISRDGKTIEMVTFKNKVGRIRIKKFANTLGTLVNGVFTVNDDSRISKIFDLGERFFEAKLKSEPQKKNDHDYVAPLIPEIGKVIMGTYPDIWYAEKGGVPVQAEAPKKEKNKYIVIEQVNGIPSIPTYLYLLHKEGVKGVVCGLDIIPNVIGPKKVQSVIVDYPEVGSVFIVPAPGGGFAVSISKDELILPVVGAESELLTDVFNAAMGVYILRLQYDSYPQNDPLRPLFIHDREQSISKVLIRLAEQKSKFPKKWFVDLTDKSKKQKKK